MALTSLQEPQQLDTVPFFAGTAYVTVDGVIRTLEGRENEADHIVVVLTAGGKQIDCAVADVPEVQLRTLWKRRCNVRGIAHYSGGKGLPDRIDVREIHLVPEGGDWLKWRGSFKNVDAGWARREPPISI